MRHLINRKNSVEVIQRSFPAGDWGIGSWSQRCRSRRPSSPPTLPTNPALVAMGFLTLRVAVLLAVLGCVWGGEAAPARASSRVKIAPQIATPRTARRERTRHMGLVPHATTQRKTATPTKVAEPCENGGIRWPAGSDYCWRVRDTFGGFQGPGPNPFVPGNVNPTATGGMQFKIDWRDGNWRCAEMMLDKSLGLGDYIFVVKTDPMTVDANLVFSPFLYADDAREIDIEFAKWGDANRDPVQATLQPWYLGNSFKSYKLHGEYTVHRFRWTGTDRPEQVLFESWTADSAQPAFSWSPTTGRNFKPGDERLHINFWLYKGFGARGPANGKENVAEIACFRHCPMPAGCSPNGVKPVCF